jgi:DNA repair photolyase
LPLVAEVKVPRRLLKPATLQKSNVSDLHFIEGCGHGCPFCFARTAAETDGSGEIRMVTGASAQLDLELRESPIQPSAVFISPSTDPFPPLNQVQDETARIVEVLAGHGIDAWLMTRGFIRPRAMEVLCKHAARVKVTVAVTTLDRQLQRKLEPLTAPPRLRLKNIRQLREAGVSCQAALEPLIPGLTDTRENLLPLLEELSAAGIRQISVGYLVLHGKAERDLGAVLHESGLDSLVLDEYTGGPLLRPANGVVGRYLARARRQHGYAAVMALAAGLGMRVTINAMTNPDFTATPAVSAGMQGGGRLQLVV